MWWHNFRVFQSKSYLTAIKSNIKRFKVLLKGLLSIIVQNSYWLHKVINFMNQWMDFVMQYSINVEYYIGWIINVSSLMSKMLCFIIYVSVQHFKAMLCYMVRMCWKTDTCEMWCKDKYATNSCYSPPNSVCLHIGQYFETWCWMWKI